MSEFTDQLGRKIFMEKIPLRIISLVPSQTELLFDLGLGDEVVGITKFCIHPDRWFHSKEKIGGTKQIDLEKIKALKPDLIIGNKEENDKGQLEELMKDYKVWMSDIKTLPAAYEMIRKVGVLVGKKEKAESLASEIELQFSSFENETKSFPKKRVAYFIWKNPWMVAGKETFINEMLNYCRMENVFSNLEDRYPEIIPTDLSAADPELILLSSEPYPFKEKHIQELKAVCPKAKIVLVDGEYFSWYGTRLLRSTGYFRGFCSSI